MNKFYVRCGNLSMAILHKDAKCAALKVLKFYSDKNYDFTLPLHEFVIVTETGFELRLPTKEYPKDFDTSFTFETYSLLTELQLGY